MIFRNLMLGLKQSSSCDIPDGYVQDGCILCYDGYTAPSGGVWKDLSGKGNDLTLGTGVTYDETNHYITFSTSPSLVKKEIVLPTFYTIEILYKATSGQWVFLNRNSSATNYCPRLYQGDGNAPLLSTLTNSGPINADFSNNLYMSIYDITYGGHYYSSKWSYMLHTLISDQYHSQYIGSRLITDGDADTIVYDNYGGKGSYSFVANASFNLLSFEDLGVQVWMMRIYNKALTETELLQNRLLDILRFNMNCTELEVT